MLAPNYVVVFTNLIASLFASPPPILKLTPRARCVAGRDGRIGENATRIGNPDAVDKRGSLHRSNANPDLAGYSSRNPALRRSSKCNSCIHLWRNGLRRKSASEALG